jgi:hypothetical protein
MLRSPEMRDVSSAVVLVNVGISAALFSAAAPKAVVPSPFLNVLESLWPGRIGIRALQAVRWAIVVAEGATGFLLVLAPASMLALASTLALFIAFAAAGTYARLSRIAIACSCFGRLHQRTLGLTHVAQLPLVVLALGVIQHVSPNPNSAVRTAGLMASLSMAGAFLLFSTLPWWTEVRNARVSLDAASRFGISPLADSLGP